MGLAVLCFVVGLLGTVLPILPGTVIVWAGIVAHWFWMGERSVSGRFVLITLGVTILVQLLDVLFTWWGARRFGATWKGALGAVLGGIVGIFFGPMGIIIGPIVGAILFEYINLRNHDQALKAGVGAIVGGLLSMVVKIVLTAGMIAAFFVYLPDTPLV